MGERDGQQARAAATETEQPAATQQPAAAPKHTSAAQADQMLASLVGRRSTPPANAEHVFGEAVVGSDNNIEQIHAPWNLGDTPAMAHFSVSGDAFELVSLEVMTLKPSGAMKGDDLAYAEHASPKIAFKPRRAGEARGTLTITIKWPMDGHVETQTINLSGSARELNEAPEQGLAISAPGQDLQVPAGPRHASAKDKRRAVDYGMAEATATANTAAEDLANAQQRGIGLAEREASAYKKALPKGERAIWWDLVEMALTLATGRIATAVARKLLPRMLTKTTTEEVFTETVTTTTTTNLGETLTMAIEDGVRFSGALAIRGGLPSKKGSQPDESLPAGVDGQNSSNARIDFFEAQRDLIEKEREGYRRQVGGALHRVLPLTARDPAMAEQTLEAVASSFREAKEEAKLAQADAVAPAWVTAVARMSLGQENAETHHHASRTATKLNSTRKLDSAGHVSAANGVLDVYVASGRIVSAQLNGVSQEIADRLAAMTLANVPLPIRFVIGGPADANPTIITRDEAGRVRIAGDIDGHDHEADNVKTASSMIDRFLGLPLKALHLEVKTDDSTGRGP